MRNLVAYTVVAFVSASLSGCILDLGDEAPEIEDYTIGRKVVVTINDQTEDPDRVEEVVKTRFEYRHHAPDAPASALTATYTSEGGALRTEPFTRFTSQATVKTGDIVSIDAVNLTSGLIVKQGDTVLAERGAFAAPWMKVGDLPLPFATSQEGVARYDLFSEAKFDFEVTGFEGGEGMYVERVKGSVRGAIDGTTTLRTRAGAAGPRLEFDVMGKPDVDFLVEARVRQEGQTYDMGARVYDDGGEVSAQGMLQFDGSHQLIRTGFGGRQSFDMRVHAWDQEHPRSQNWEPEGVEHPLVDERQEYREEAVNASELDVDAWVTSFLSRLWSMEVGVGDDYRLHFEEKSSTSAPAVTFDYIVQVAADDERTVGAVTVPTHRVSQRASLIIDPKDGSPSDFDLFRSTYWISRDTHLPVHIQASHAQTFNKDKLLGFFDFLGEEAPKDLPDAARLVLSEKGTISLREYSGDAVLSPIVGILAGNQAWLAGAMGAASVFALASDLGGESASTAPLVELSVDEASDRLVVVSGASMADWNRLEISRVDRSSTGVLNVGGSDDGIHVNEAAVPGDSSNDVAAWGVSLSDFYLPMAVGDYVELCSSAATSAMVQVVDTVANTVVGRFSFASIRLC